MGYFKGIVPFDKTATSPEIHVKWCQHCGEGVTTFCRNKHEGCALQLPKPGTGSVTPHPELTIHTKEPPP